MIRRRIAEFFGMPAFDNQGNDVIAEIPAEEIEMAMLVIQVESEIQEQRNPSPDRKKPLVAEEDLDLYQREDDED